MKRQDEWIVDALASDAQDGAERELRIIERIVRENLESLRNEWDEFCSGYIS